jgi:putative transcriptional regulator
MSTQKPIAGKGKRGSRRGFLNGQLLIAMPGMRDQRFARSVVYMCAHSEEGAMGLIINQHADKISFFDLLVQAKVLPEGGKGKVPQAIKAMRVHVGGPVETGRGFVLHSSEYKSTESTLPIDGETSLTATIDILRAIAGGSGPSRSLLALGYAGWSSGQLEREIQNNGWLHCPADPELVFASDVEGKYERALSKLGVDPTHLVSEAGHA